MNIISILMLVLSIALLTSTIAWITHVKELRKDVRRIESYDVYSLWKDFKKLKDEFHSLELCHAFREESLYNSMSYVKTFEHKKEVCDTEQIDNLTLEELAKYVLDNEPIVRTETIKKEFKKGE